MLQYCVDCHEIFKYMEAFIFCAISDHYLDNVYFLKKNTVNSEHKCEDFHDPMEDSIHIM